MTSLFEAIQIKISFPDKKRKTLYPAHLLKFAKGIERPKAISQANSYLNYAPAPQSLWLGARGKFQAAGDKNHCREQAHAFPQVSAVASGNAANLFNDLDRCMTPVNNKANGYGIQLIHTQA